MADQKLTALSEISVPALEDLLYIVDDPSGTPASNKVTVQRLGGLLLHDICEGRLTTESGVPVSSSDRTAQSTLYFTPFHGTHVSLYDGTRWRLYAFTERSLALSSLTSGKNYDVFLYDNAGTLTLELSAAWTNDTTRADALTTQDGVWVKSGATTRRYLGTIRTTGTDTTEDSKSKRFVWNNYNRVVRVLSRNESTDSWTYSTATYRQANGNTANQVEYVCGLVEDTVACNIIAIANGSAPGQGGTVGVGLDSTTVNSAFVYGANFPDTFVTQLACTYEGYPGLGYHALVWLEKGFGSGTQTWYGDAGDATTYATGIAARIRG